LNVLSLLSGNELGLTINLYTSPAVILRILTDCFADVVTGESSP